MRERRRWRSFLIMLIAASAITLVLVVGSSHAWTAIAIIAAATTTLTLIASLLAYGYEKYVRPARPSRRIQPEENISPEELLRQIRDTSDHVDVYQQVCFARLLTDPQASVRRIVEKIYPLKRVFRQRVSISASVPLPDGAPSQFFYFPLLTVPKGELQDGFRVRLDDGNSVPVLNFVEYCHLVGQIIRTLAVVAEIPRSRVKFRLPDGTPRSALQIVNEAIALVCRRGPFTSGDKESVNTCLDLLGGVARYSRKPEHVDTIRSLVDALSTHYPLAAVVPRPAERKRVVIKYERYVIPKLRIVRGRPLRRSAELLGMLLGARPIELWLKIDLAVTAQSYHLLVYGPEGSYVGAQDLEGAEEYLATFSSEKRPYLRPRRRLGQSYAHAYFRNVKKESPASPLVSYRVRFYEVPPGSIAKASVAAIAILVLSYIIAWILSNSQTPPGSDFPALALAFPALIAAWIGLEPSQSRLLSGTLTSRVSSVATVVCSLAASAVFMAQTSDEKFRFRLADFSVLGESDLYWLVILGVAAVNAVWASFAWVGYTVHYYLLAGRDIWGTPDSSESLSQASG